MHRIDTATKAPDLYGAGKHGFRNGDKANGIAATALDADFFNSLQEELAAVVEGAGLTLDKDDRTQLWQALLGKFASATALGDYAPLASPALTGSPTAPTPAQFDASTLLATTEFVQRALGNVKDYHFINTSTVLTAAAAGETILSNGNINITLPEASSVRRGSVIEVFSYVGTATILLSGADTFAGVLSSSTVGQFNSGRYMSNGVNVWAPIGGTESLRASSAFAASLAANGYQTLPSGLIIKTGAVAKPTTTSPLSITFPVAFPNHCYQVIAGFSGAANKANGVSAAAFSTTGFSAYTAVGDANSNVTYIAVGD